MSSATRHRLPLAGVLRLGRPSDIWFKPALSVVAAVAPPNLILLALGRLDLAMYTMAGSLCALYGHNRPYAARARVLAGVVLGMAGGLTVSLVTASLTGDAVVLVTVGAVMAAVQKAVSDATRLGPPANVVLTFISSASLFAPQTLGQVPGHIALALATGTWAWLIGMAPGLLRPYGPERRATAQALNAAAAYAETRGAADGHARTRSASAAAIHAAWQSLLAAGARPDRTRRALERLLVRAEVALAAPADTDTDPARLRAWARELRGTGRIPRVDSPRACAGALLRAEDAEDDELLGVQAERAHPRPSARHRLAALAPLAARTAIGCALAGYASLALGVGRPYWALVTAASLYQANVTLTWSRGVQRVVGNVVGVLLFAALAPLARLHPAALVLCALALTFGAEALISRNYWLGSVCVTPMALLVTEFARAQNPAELMTERVADTVVGALVGFVAAVAVTNRRAGDRLGHALTAAERARERAARLLAEPHPAPHALESARRALAAALVDLRATADAASGEWWQRALPEERVVLAEQSGHRTLAATVRRQGFVPQARAQAQEQGENQGRGPGRTTEDIRP
ncbi:FUSC family protein [Streptomyces alanosinicus]|uniref:FUSC family protein n=1 Tax=Streptomyces alanosinicus TaxID=68171 RepID=A0A919D3G6_9ACTN|nr:FUSC family protein [Streptomyces alanosinicus]GHE03017.1 FUSC family protein [Streptomyces alanosinicus]